MTSKFVSGRVLPAVVEDELQVEGRGEVPLVPLGVLQDALGSVLTGVGPSGCPRNEWKGSPPDSGYCLEMQGLVLTNSGIPLIIHYIIG